MKYTCIDEFNRTSNIFPVRRQRFLCDDARYYQSYEDANTQRNYLIISNLTLYILCLSIPILVVCINEISVLSSYILFKIKIIFIILFRIDFNF